jgi:hypothetical protein
VATAAGSSNEPATLKESMVAPDPRAMANAPEASRSVISEFQRAVTIATRAARDGRAPRPAAVFS